MAVKSLFLHVLVVWHRRLCCIVELKSCSRRLLRAARALKLIRAVGWLVASSEGVMRLDLRPIPVDPWCMAACADRCCWFGLLVLLLQGGCDEWQAI